MSPWQLLKQAAALDAEALAPAARAALERCQQLSLQLGAASKERILHGLLPSSAVPAFVAADSNSDTARAQQMAALMQVRTHADSAQAYRHVHTDKSQFFHHQGCYNRLHCLLFFLVFTFMHKLHCCQCQMPMPSFHAEVTVVAREDIDFQ